jgi:eukaryotic-like serine/threonine-protein kinase
MVHARHLRHHPSSRAAKRAAPLTAPDPRVAFERAREALGPRYHLERIVASSAERVLFEARDETLKRRVGVRVNFYSDDAVRAWFMRESEALGQLDDPGILHVYDAGQVGDLAYRIGNWVDGEGLQEAVGRGPRPIPTVFALARDLLGALEHAHLHGIIVRAISPRSILVSAGGRATVTDLRYCSYCLSAVPPGASPPALAFMAPEIRDGAVGDPASDIYTVGAILYSAITGQEPAIDPGQVRRPTELRPTCPRVIERIVLRALQAEPASRYFTAA